MNSTTPTTPKAQMRSNLTGQDRSFSGFSYPQQVGTTPPPGRPLAPQTSGSNNPFLANNPPLRRSSTVSTASDYEPGVDLSSYDVSTTRAMPGYRGAHGTFLDGWAEEGDSGGVIPKTWEEEQERRRAAERELHRRREVAEKEEMERRLGEEFWRGEEERFGPVVPEKMRPHSTGSGSANGALAMPVPGSNQGRWGRMNQGAMVAGSAPVGGNYLGGVPPPPPPPLIQLVQQPVQQSIQQPIQQPVQQQPQQDLLIHEEQEKQPQQQPQDKTPQAPQADGDTPSLPEPAPAAPPPARDSSPEAYQIKHITWVDPTTSQTRRSPILLQNENGPCPLLALVNALTLSTPSSATTALTEILRVREHVSLGLLLDAVFDGVVTRASTQDVDIDMSDLFAFLMSLSTGMNVNPRFVFPQLPSGDNGPPQLLGSFDQTREMRLYNSFGVPLYHGWLPSPAAAVYRVMQRAAPTYEEVQNLLLQEEIILHRISTALGGSPESEITRQEERVVEDAGVIRGWLDDSCTQLTDWGLESLTRWWGGNVHDGAGASLGKLGILFRNDHFCTVMKARLPGREGEVLLSLVTDMGYGGYEEVVWESLVSVNGQGGGFLTGDYRPVGGEDGAGVGGAGGRQVRSMVDVDDDEGWETAGGNRRRGGQGGRGQHGHQDQRYQHPPQNVPQQQQHQHQYQQHTPPSRRSFVDTLLGRGGQQQQQLAQASLWHQPTGPQPPRGTQNPTQLTQHHNNSLPNNPIPPPMLPPRTSSRTDNSTPTPPHPTNTNPLDLSSLQNAIAEPTGGPDGHSTDYDLALAMQLQEEEDERERQRLERQRRHQSAPPQTPYSGGQPPQPLQPPQRRPESEQRLRNGGGSQRDAPPPPYEQHVQDQRHPAHQAHPQQGGYIPHIAGTSAPELARFSNPASGHHQPVSGVGVLGGAPRGYDPNASLGRRRSEAMRRAHDARGLLNEVAGQGGNGYPGQQGPAWGGHPGGPHAHAHGRRGSGGGSYREGGGKKDCVIM